MTKTEFLDELRSRLSGLPQSDLDERLLYFREMIDDRMEDGLTEEEAVSDIGSVDEIVDHIMEETPLSKLVRENAKRTRALKAWEILLLVLGAPLWLSLILAAIAVCLSLYGSGCCRRTGHSCFLCGEPGTGQCDLHAGRSDPLCGSCDPAVLRLCPADKGSDESDEKNDSGHEDPPDEKGKLII